MYRKGEREREKEVVASIVTARWQGREQEISLSSCPHLYSSHSDILQSVGYRGFSHIWVSTLTLCVPSLAYFIFCFSVHNPTARLWPSTTKRIDSYQSGIRAWFVQEI